MKDIRQPKGGTAAHGNRSSIEPANDSRGDLRALLWPAQRGPTVSLEAPFTG